MSRHPAAAADVFGDRLWLAVRFGELLVDQGMARGVLGPREADRLWERHLLNSAVIGEVVPQAARVLDLGSGAGFPGIPLALARPDLEVTLLEPMARRVRWLTEVAQELSLPVRVRRGRAEDDVIRAELRGQDIVTARAVAPLHRLAAWGLPLVRMDGQLVAMKGETAAAEIARDRATVRRLGGTTPTLVRCGEAVLQAPTTVVVMGRQRSEAAAPRSGRTSRERTRRRR